MVGVSYGTVGIDDEPASSNISISFDRSYYIASRMELQNISTSIVYEFLMNRDNFLIVMIDITLKPSNQPFDLPEDGRLFAQFIVNGTVILKTALVDNNQEKSSWKMPRGMKM